MGQDASFIDPNALPAAVFREFEAEPALADPGFADHADHPSMALDGMGEFGFEGGELAAPPDQGSQAPAAAEYIAGRRIQQLGQLEQFHRRGDAADGLHPERLDLHELPGAGIGVPGDEDATLVRHLLQPIGEVHVGAGGIVGLVDAVFDRLHDDLTGMDADADLQARVRKPRDRVLHRQGREAAADGMVLMRPRRAEQRHHAIALDLVDDTVVAMDGVLHEIEHGLEKAHPQFGIAQAIDQTGRIADVGEKDGEAFAFPAFAAQRAQDALRCRILVCRGRRQRCTALAAEPAGCPVDVAAGFTLDPERRAAAFAIVVAVPVFAIALRALHAQILGGRVRCLTCR